MRLYIVRHAKSSWKHAKRQDIERPLNKRGRHDAPLMAAHLAHHGVQPSLVLLSDSKRTIETAHALCAGLGLDPQRLNEDHRLYLADAATMCDVLRGAAPEHAEVMLIGHNPGVTDLVGLLTGTPLDAEVPTMTVATLDITAPSWDQLHTGCAKLVSCIAPKALQKSAA